MLRDGGGALEAQLQKSVVAAFARTRAAGSPRSGERSYDGHHPNQTSRGMARPRKCGRAKRSFYFRAAMRISHVAVIFPCSSRVSYVTVAVKVS